MNIKEIIKRIIDCLNKHETNTVVFTINTSDINIGVEKNDAVIHCFTLEKVAHLLDQLEYTLCKLAIKVRVVDQLKAQIRD